jgi:FMN-dependent NADH-azoreductase
MANLLFVASSLFGDGSRSRLIASEFIDRWRQSHPRTTVIDRELTADSIPHLSLATFAASTTPADARSAAERQATALADALIEEVEAADVIVIAAPMYNFSIPSTLKAWIDHIARAGRTFSYGAAGAEGLLKGRKVFIITGRGGVYSDNSSAKSMDLSFKRGMP